MTTPLVTRAVNILTKPAEEWVVIRGETTDTKSLFMGYALPLALIGPVCGLISVLLFVGLLGPLGLGAVLMSAIVGAVLGVAISLLAVFLLGIIINALASSFGTQQNKDQAMKVAVYSMTASWVAGLLTLVPAVGGLLALLAGLYGFYLLYLGLQKVMDTPQDKAVIYTLVLFLIMAVILGVAMTIIGVITAAMMMGAAAAAGAGAYALS